MSSTYVILSPDPAFSVDLARHVEDVASLTGLVAYDVRQRLLRPGVSLLATLEQDRAEDVAAALRGAGYRATAIPKSTLGGASQPERVASVEVGADGVSLLGVEGRLLGTVDASCDVLLVAGDTQADPMAVSQARKRSPDPEQALVEVSRGAPALRIYVRGRETTYILMGRRFNYTSLGEAVSVSAALNFQALVHALRAAAGSSVLDLDFRLADLPSVSVTLMLDERSEAMDAFELHARVSQRLWDEHALDGFSAWASPDASPQVSEYAESVDAASRVMSDDTRQRSGGLHTLQRLGPWWMVVGLTGLWGLIILARLDSIEASGILAAFFLVLSVVPLRLGVIDLLRKREIEDYPTSRARSVAMGKVEVSGRAAMAVPMKAPWSGVDCVWFRWTQMSRVQQHDGKETWRTTGRGTSGDLPFLVEDDSGRVLVDPAGAEVAVSNSSTISGSYVTMINGAVTSIPMGSDTRVVEETIPAGRAVYVLGTARPVREAGEGRAALRKKLRALKANPERLRGFDVDEDGHIDPEEWAAAVASAERELAREQLSAGGEENFGAVIGRGPEGCLFLISDRSEEELVRRIALRAWASLLGGALALGGGVWGVLSS